MFRKIFILVFSIFISFGFFYFAEDTPETEPEKPIVITRHPKPRTPDYASDITAYYQSGVIYLNFGSDMGG